MRLPSLTPLAGALRSALLLCVLAPAPSAQVWEACNVLDAFPGEAGGDQFGWVGVNAGDVDGDGTADLIVGAPFHDAAGANAGRAYVYSGAGGGLLFTFDGESNFAQLGTDVAAAGDVDGDGLGDVIVGAPSNAGGAGRAYVLLGPAGTLHATLMHGTPGDRFGAAVSCAGDVDGDGHDDLIVGAPSDDTAGANAGRAYVYSGLTGAPIRSHDGFTSADRFGSSVGFLTDRDHDGRGDYIVGASNAGAQGRGEAYVFSGTGALDCTLATDATGVNYGQFFIGYCGDVNADGEPDFFVSDWANSALGPGTGRVFVYSGLDCATLLVLTGDRPGAGFGIGRGWAGDYDGDGRDDLFFGSWTHPAGGPGAGRGEVRSGSDGSLLASFTGDVAGAALGFDAAGMGDVDGDGRPDFALTAAYDTGQRGAAYVQTSAPELPRTYCAAAPNSHGPGARIGYRRSLSIAAAELELVVTEAAPTRTAIFVYAVERSDPAPLDDGFLCVTGNVIRRLDPFQLDASGAGAVAVDFGSAPIAPGSTWHFQCWFRDPAAQGAGFNLSDALRVRFCP